ncbi:MAG: hypothetical protein HYZ42_01265 [Bacteroidetes bacterium]|nr:hypothetical protein [Bacteroidota bacterium]
MKNTASLVLILFLMTTLSCSKEKYSNDEKSQRQKVIDDYFNIKRTNEIYSYNATGEDQDNCKKGKLDASIYSKIINSINYYRRAAGCAEIALDSGMNEECQAMLLMSVSNLNNIKNNIPLDSTWKCYSKEAALAYGSSISSSEFYTNAEGPIEHFFNKDEDAVNRRWLLNYELVKVGYGQFKSYFGIKVLGTNVHNSSQPKPNFIAWPANGFIMNEILPKVWTFCVPNADFSEATVTVKTRDLSKTKNYVFKRPPMIDLEISLNKTGLLTIGGDPTLIWTLGSIKIDDFFKDEDIEFEVSVKNVKVNGEYKNYDYKVTSIVKVN